VRGFLQQVQGNVFPGFSYCCQHYLFFRVHDPASLQSLLKEVGDNIASAAMLIDEAESVPAVNVAFSFPFLMFVCKQTENFVDEAFRSGMAARATLLADDPPECWLFGDTRAPVDIVVVVGGNDQVETACFCERVAKTPGFSLIFWQMAGRLDGGVEHFGFRDNISQPHPVGFPITRTSTAESNFEQVQPGEFIFGHSTEGGDQPTRHSQDRFKSCFPGWAVNGSYCVIRRLRQDVAQFHAFVKNEACRLDINPTQLASQMIGRYPDGTRVNPARDLPERLIPTSHVEKMNPNGLSPRHGLSVPNTNDNRRHRILRRGLPFGGRSKSTFDAPSDDGLERGLMFVCYQTSIVDQFEFIQRRWANEANFPRENGGMDPLIAQTKPGEARMMRLDGGPRMHRVLQKWIITTGGGYFFAPSLDTTRRLLAKRSL
jgi:Dyp-type peroxidase family